MIMMECVFFYVSWELFSSAAWTYLFVQQLFMDCSSNRKSVVQGMVNESQIASSIYPTIWSTDSYPYCQTMTSLCLRAASCLVRSPCVWTQRCHAATSAAVVKVDKNDLMKLRKVGGKDYFVSMPCFVNLLFWSIMNTQFATTDPLIDVGSKYVNPQGLQQKM